MGRAEEPDSALPPASPDGPPAPTWLSATDAEAWALGAGQPGFVKHEDLHLRARLSEAIGEAEVRLGDLRSRLEDAETRGYRNGLRRAADEATPALRGLEALERGWRDILVEAATEAALAAAESLIHDRCEAQAGSVAARIRHALDAYAGSAPLGIRVAPGGVALVRGAIPSVPVTEDPTLAAGDAIIDLTDGQVDLRVAALLGVARGDVAAAIEAALAEEPNA